MGPRPYLLLCMFLAFLAAPGEVLSQSASDLGEAQGNSVLNIYGSKSGVTNNVSNPLTSSNTPMTTVDGSTSFSGQLQCPNSQKFMEVLIQPGATGDIDTFIVSQDTNFDGTPDYTFQVPFPVSGICANGVITCDPGRGPTAGPTGGRRTHREGSLFSRLTSRRSAAASASTTPAAPTSSSATPRPS